MFRQAKPQVSRLILKHTGRHTQVQRSGNRDYRHKIVSYDRRACCNFQKMFSPISLPVVRKTYYHFLTHNAVCLLNQKLIQKIVKRKVKSS